MIATAEAKPGVVASVRPETVVLRSGRAAQRHRTVILVEGGAMELTLKYRSEVGCRGLVLATAPTSHGRLEFAPYDEFVTFPAFVRSSDLSVGQRKPAELCYAATDDHPAERPMDDVFRGLRSCADRNAGRVLVAKFAAGAIPADAAFGQVPLAYAVNPETGEAWVATAAKTSAHGHIDEIAVDRIDVVPDREIGERAKELMAKPFRLRIA